ncbi:diguanylate cyclase [Polynucleobacter sp. AP-RePozz3-80-G7]|uniref:sensor domain-containing diguanylate cyclase n=1 Tax=Polynucleobacter sp. AP-RePozz3-80-G7 TaxID=2689105 RepID=UPI001C0E3523|nr:diguanylate cyclase [Polynucleobacter sp. AP-RePozz3-80-G7]MBU3639803.1 diguanylate cyclase [Polynucleobacter sp. AP-RePozz3-80-G7]
MLSSRYQHIKFKIKLGFCFAIFGILSATAYQIYTIWQDNFRAESLEISHNVRMANTLVEDALTDGSKLLDITKLDLKGPKGQIKLSNQEIELSLKRSVAKFQISSWFNVYGNLLCVDADGNVLAQTDGPLKRKINVADRYYFQALKEQEKEAIVISPEVTAKSNGRKVFHLAGSIVNDRGEFIGLLTIQVNSKKFKDDLVTTLSDGYETMGLYLANGKLIFSLGDQERGIAEASIAEIKSKDASGMAILLPANEAFGFGRIVANSENSKFGAYMIGEATTRKVWAQTFSSALKFLLLVFFSCLLVGYFAYQLLKSIAKIEAENHLAIHDALTHLPNRRYFDEMYPKIQGDCRRSHKPLSVLFIDIDKFKVFNDLHGHECGDKVLRVVARSILRIRKRPMDFFCRYGGEEFIFVLPDTDEQGAMHYAQEILETVSAQEIEVDDGIVVHVTVSIGVATDPDGSQNLSDDLIKKADSAMYKAKQSGRNRYEYF